MALHEEKGDTGGLASGCDRQCVEDSGERVRVVDSAHGVGQPLELAYASSCPFRGPFFPTFRQPFLYSLFSTINPASFMCTGLCLLHRGGKSFRRVAFGEGQLRGGLALSRFATSGNFPRDGLHAIGGRALNCCHALHRITLDRLHARLGASFSCFGSLNRGAFGRFQAFRHFSIGGLARLSNRCRDGLDAFRVCGMAQVDHGALQVLCRLVAEAVCERVDGPLQLIFETHDGTSI